MHRSEIAMDLLGKGVLASKPSFSAELSQENHANSLVVEIPVESHEMHLTRDRPTSKGWAGSHIHESLVASSSMIEPHLIDAPGRKQLAGDPNIGRGESHRPGPTLTGHDGTPQFNWATQEALGLREVTVLNRSSNPRARDGLPISIHRPLEHHPYPKLPTKSL